MIKYNLIIKLFFNMLKYVSHSSRYKYLITKVARNSTNSNHENKIKYRSRKFLH